MVKHLNLIDESMKSFFLLKEKSKVNSLLPVRKKAKNERGTIASFFNKKKSDPKPTKRNKIEQEVIPPDIHLGSSVQVEKTSLILFDEVRHPRS